jgi:HK97 gp10 family phage protein
MEADFATIIAKLDAANGEGLKRAQRKALKAVGQIVQEAIVAAAPVRVDDTPSGTALKPGALKDDIKARVHIATDEKVATDNSRVTIGPGKATAYVANWIENGHANPKAKSAKAKKNTPAYPFVRKAADSVQQKAQAEYEAVMKAEIAKVMDE